MASRIQQLAKLAADPGTPLFRPGEEDRARRSANSQGHTPQEVQLLNQLGTSRWETQPMAFPNAAFESDGSYTPVAAAQEGVMYGKEIPREPDWTSLEGLSRQSVQATNNPAYRSSNPSRSAGLPQASPMRIRNRTRPLLPEGQSYYSSPLHDIYSSYDRLPSSQWDGVDIEPNSIRSLAEEYSHPYAQLEPLTGDTLEGDVNTGVRNIVPWWKNKLRPAEITWDRLMGQSAAPKIEEDWRSRFSDLQKSWENDRDRTWQAERVGPTGQAGQRIQPDDLVASGHPRTRPSYYPRAMPGASPYYGVRPEPTLEQMLASSRKSRDQLTSKTESMDAFDRAEAAGTRQVPWLKPAPNRFSRFMRQVPWLKPAPAAPARARAPARAAPPLKQLAPPTPPGAAIPTPGKDLSSAGNSIPQLAKLAAEKTAFLAWGGGELGLHPKGKGIGGALGYTNLLGMLPIPTGHLDIGGPKYGMQVGVAADPGSDFGLSPMLGARFGHPRKSGLTRQFPRGIPDIIYDKLRGRTKQDAIRASYPELFEEEDVEETEAIDGDGDGKVHDGTEDERDVKAAAAWPFSKKKTLEDFAGKDKEDSGSDPSRWHYYGDDDGSNPDLWEYLPDGDPRVKAFRKKRKEH